MAALPALRDLLALPVKALPPDLQAVIALAHPDCSPARAAEVVAGANGLREMARRTRLLPLIFDRWRPELESGLPAEDLAAWRAASLDYLTASLRQRAEAVALLRELSRAQVPVIVARGLWLSETIYAQRHHRPHADVDLLVPVEAREAVRALMSDLGFTFRGDEPVLSVEAAGARLARGLWAALGGWSREPGGLRFAVDIHHTPSLVGGGWFPYRPDWEFLQRRSAPWEFEGLSLRALQPPFALLEQCTHIFRHAVAGLAEDTLTSYNDVALLGRGLSADQWEQVVADARELHLRPQLAVVLRKVEEMWGGCAPGGLGRRLGPGKVRRRFIAWVIRRPALLRRDTPSAVLKVCERETAADQLAYLGRKLLRRV